MSEALPSMPPALGEPPPAPPLPPTPPLTGAEPPDDSGPILDLTAVRTAAASLRERRLLSAEEYYQLDAIAKQEAFTISGALTDAAVERIHRRLTENIAEGASLRAFRSAVLEDFDSLPISAPRLEQVFRNNTAEAFSQGVETILDHPLVGDAFPYRLYTAVHDARARHEHLALEKLGLDGTAVYHKDDPTWKRFRPPWAWGCRCDWVAITIEQAASLGVREAQEWLRFGIEPQHPPVPIPPFAPPVGWDRVAALVS